MTDNGYMTSLEAAEYLRVTPTTIWKWAKAGLIGGRGTAHSAWRFTKQELDKFIQGDKSEADTDR